MKTERLLLWLVAIVALLLSIWNAIGVGHNCRMIDIILETQGVILECLKGITNILTMGAWL